MTNAKVAYISGSAMTKRLNSTVLHSTRVLISKKKQTQSSLE